jgi:hypothetical protein
MPSLYFDIVNQADAALAKGEEFSVLVDSDQLPVYDALSLHYHGDAMVSLQPCEPHHLITIRNK